MPDKTTATIDRERREALYELVFDHLSGIGDFWIAVEEKDFSKAERLGIEFSEDFRLLEDIGWEPEHGPANVDLSIPPHDLIELMRRLRGEAESVLEGSACARLLEKEEESAKQRYQRAKATCEQLIEQLDHAEADATSATSGFPRVEAQATGRTEVRSWAFALPRPSESRSRRCLANVRPSDQAAGAVQAEGEGQQSHGEVDATGRDPEQAATEGSAFT